MTFRCQFHTDLTRSETQCVQEEEPGESPARGSHLHRNALGERWHSVPTSPSSDMENTALDAYSIVVAKVSDRGNVFTAGDHQRALRAAMAAVLRRTPLAVRYENAPDDDAFVTTSQAAEMLGISRPSLMDKIRNEVIPALESGRRHRVRMADILRFREERRQRQAKAFEELRELTEEEGDQ